MTSNSTECYKVAYDRVWMALVSIIFDCPEPLANSLATELSMFTKSWHDPSLKLLNMLISLWRLYMFYLRPSSTPYDILC